MEEKVTVYDVLQATVEILSDINIPAGLIDQIGIPVSRGISNLKECIRAIEEDEANHQNAEVDEDV